MSQRCHRDVSVVTELSQRCHKRNGLKRTQVSHIVWSVKRFSGRDISNSTPGATSEERCNKKEVSTPAPSVRETPAGTPEAIVILRDLSEIKDVNGTLLSQRPLRASECNISDANEEFSHPWFQRLLSAVRLQVSTFTSFLKKSQLGNFENVLKLFWELVFYLYKKFWLFFEISQLRFFFSSSRDRYHNTSKKKPRLAYPLETNGYFFSRVPWTNFTGFFLQIATGKFRKCSPTQVCCCLYDWLT